MGKTERHNHLERIQHWMQEALVFSGQKTPKAEIANYIKASPNLNAQECLAIYQRSYYSRLVHCLHDQFKALSYALGQELFSDFSREYLKTYPSNSPTLSELGARFPDFLRETRPDLHAEEKEDWVEFMIDLAQFEWNLYLMFDAKGHEGKPYADDTKNDEDLRLQSCFSLSTYQFPVADFYHAVAEQRHPEIPAPQKNFVAHCRHDYLIRTFSITPVQYFFLERIMQKENIGDALKATSNKFEFSDSEIQEAWKLWRGKWLKAGFFI